MAQQKLSKIHTPMDEDFFWKIVEASLKNSDDMDDQAENLIDTLEALSPEEIVGFRLRTDKLLYDSYTPELWCAASIMNGGSSDDSFEYFRNWLISRGKTVFYNALKNPDSLVELAGDDEDQEYEFEEFWYVANDAFDEKTDRDLFAYYDYDNFTTCEGNYPEITPTWKEDEPETMKAICPRLFERFKG